MVGRDHAIMSYPVEKKQNASYGNHREKVLAMVSGFERDSILSLKVGAYGRKQKEIDILDPSEKDEFLYIHGTKFNEIQGNKSNSCFLMEMFSGTFLHKKGMEINSHMC